MGGLRDCPQGFDFLVLPQGHPRQEGEMDDGSTVSDTKNGDLLVNRPRLWLGGGLWFEPGAGDVAAWGEATSVAEAGGDGPGSPSGTDDASGLGQFWG